MVHTATFLGKDILGGAVNMNEIKINNPKEKNKKKGAHFYAALGICMSGCWSRCIYNLRQY